MPLNTCAVLAALLLGGWAYEQVGAGSVGRGKTSAGGGEPAALRRPAACDRSLCGGEDPQVLESVSRANGARRSGSACVATGTPGDLSLGVGAPEGSSLKRFSPALRFGRDLWRGPRGQWLLDRGLLDGFRLADSLFPRGVPRQAALAKQFGKRLFEAVEREGLAVGAIGPVLVLVKNDAPRPKLLDQRSLFGDVLCARSRGSRGDERDRFVLVDTNSRLFAGEVVVACKDQRAQSLGEEHREASLDSAGQHARSGIIESVDGAGNLPLSCRSIVSGEENRQQGDARHPVSVDRQSFGGAA